MFGDDFEVINPAGQYTKFNSFGQNGLYQAIASGNFETANNIIITNKLDLGNISRLGDNILHAAAAGSNALDLKIVIASVNDDEAREYAQAANLDGQTPLHLAAKNGAISTAEHLLALADTRTTINKAGKTAFDLAYENGHYALAGMLVHKNITLGKLLEIIKSGNVDLVRSIFRAGVQVSGHDKSIKNLPEEIQFDHNVLLNASLASAQPVEMTKLLLDHGVKFDQYVSVYHEHFSLGYSHVLRLALKTQNPEIIANITKQFFSSLAKKHPNLALADGGAKISSTGHNKAEVEKAKSRTKLSTNLMIAGVSSFLGMIFVDLFIAVLPATSAFVTILSFAGAALALTAIILTASSFVVGATYRNSKTPEETVEHALDEVGKIFINAENEEAEEKFASFSEKLLNNGEAEMPFQLSA